MRTIATLLLMTTLSLSALAQEQAKVSYTPQVFGAVKAKFELSTFDGEYRFNVRNSRIGIKGAVSQKMRYSIQIDFNNEGKIAILDSYATYLHKNLEISIGQQQYRFSSDLDRGPSSNFFANRSFLAKFLTSYQGSEIASGKASYYVKTIGSRDIGALARYKFTTLPLRLSLGAFNGAGTNNPEWSSNINIVARIEIGNESGLGGAVSHYNGRTPILKSVGVTEDDQLKMVDFTQHLRMWGAELHYKNDRYLIEAEYAQRRLSSPNLELLQVAYIHGYYKFNMPKNLFAQYIAPLARFDMGDDIDFINAKTKLIDKFSTGRVTLGINFGFINKLIGSELRFNYEKYIMKHKPSDLNINKLLQDKFTIEVVASF